MNTKRELSPRIIDTIRQYESSGGTFILATGRTMLTARNVIESIGLNTPVISGNGSVIQYPAGEILIRHVIPEEACLSVCGYAMTKGFDFVAFTDSALWYPYTSVKVEYIKRLNKESEQRRITLFEFSKIDELPSSEIIKLFIWNMDKLTVEDLEATCNTGKTMSFVQSVRGALDIDPIQATKGNGLRFLADHLNIQLENTAAFGDNINDLDMLQSVGFPVAVANAEDELKRAAWKICPSNDECGVAVMLEEFMRG